MVTDAIEAELRVLEERLAMPAACESCASLAALLAPGFREFGSSGRIYDAAATLGALTPGARPRLVLEDFAVAPVADGAVLVTYRSKTAAGPGWKPPALRSSLWVRSSAGWQLLFHQGTRLPAAEG
jgi:hypothetical protein